MSQKWLNVDTTVITITKQYVVMGISSIYDANNSAVNYFTLMLRETSSSQYMHVWSERQWKDDDADGWLEKWEKRSTTGNRRN